MKKSILILSLLVIIFLGCSTPNDGNNSATNTVPLPPSNLTGTTASTTQVNLSWTDNSTNETGFKIERKTDTENYTFIGMTSAEISTFNDNGLTPSTNYTYRIYSYNSAGISPTYSNEFTVKTNATTVTDIDGNVYQMVKICNQIWTKTNLNVSKYRNGDIIPQVTDAATWSKLGTGAWCYYENITANGTTYGKLYNGWAINDPRGLAPIGWHIPSDDEWEVLITCLGEKIVAGGKMKETGTMLWQNPNGSATNSSGFTAIPGGSRAGSADGQFINIGYVGNWWSSSIDGPFGLWVRNLTSSNGAVYRYSYGRNHGLSVRCIKD